MSTIARVILVAALAFGSGCAKSDWIQQTLVTVDVTGTWRSTEGSVVDLLLEQQGSKVTGSIRRGTFSGPIVGTVGGDLFRFKQTSGPPVEGEMAVSGDEMTGEMRNLGGMRDTNQRRVILHRIDSSAPPRSR